MYGITNNNSKYRQLKRKIEAGLGSFMYMLMRQAEASAQPGCLDAALRIKDFIGEHFEDEAPTEGICDYLAHLVDSISQDIAQDLAKALAEGQKDTQKPIRLFKTTVGKNGKLTRRQGVTAFLSDGQLHQIAQQEGLDCTRTDWLNGIDSQVLKEAREGYYKPVSEMKASQKT